MGSNRSPSSDSDKTFCSLIEISGKSARRTSNKESSVNAVLHKIHERVRQHFEGKNLLGNFEIIMYLKEIKRLRVTGKQNKYLSEIVVKALLNIYKLNKRFENSLHKDTVCGLSDPMLNCNITQDLQAIQNKDGPQTFRVPELFPFMNSRTDELGSFPSNIMSNQNFISDSSLCSQGAMVQENVEVSILVPADFVKDEEKTMHANVNSCYMQDQDSNKDLRVIESKGSLMHNTIDLIHSKSSKTEEYNAISSTSTSVSSTHRFKPIISDSFDILTQTADLSGVVKNTCDNTCNRAILGKVQSINSFNLLTQTSKYQQYLSDVVMHDDNSFKRPLSRQQKLETTKVRKLIPIDKTSNIIYEVPNIDSSISEKDFNKSIITESYSTASQSEPSDHLSNTENARSISTIINDPSIINSYSSDDKISIITTNTEMKRFLPKIDRSKINIKKFNLEKIDIPEADLLPSTQISLRRNTNGSDSMIPEAVHIKTTSLTEALTNKELDIISKKIIRTNQKLFQNTACERTINAFLPEDAGEKIDFNFIDHLSTEFQELSVNHIDQAFCDVSKGVRSWEDINREFTPLEKVTVDTAQSLFKSFMSICSNEDNEDKEFVKVDEIVRLHNFSTDDKIEVDLEHLIASNNEKLEIVSCEFRENYFTDDISDTNIGATNEEVLLSDWINLI